MFFSPVLYVIFYALFFGLGNVHMVGTCLVIAGYQLIIYKVFISYISVIRQLYVRYQLVICLVFIGYLLVISNITFELYSCVTFLGFYQSSLYM